VDKKLHEKDFLPGQKLPVEIVPVHDAWIEMKKKLEDEIPDAAIIIPQANKSPKQKKILRGSLLLLLLLITFVFIYKLNNKSVSPKISAHKETVLNNDQRSRNKNLSGKKQTYPVFQRELINESNENKNIVKDENSNPVNVSGKNISSSKKDQNKKVNYKRAKAGSNKKSNNILKKKKKQVSKDLKENSGTDEIAATHIPNEIQGANESAIQQNVVADSLLKKEGKKDIKKDSVQTLPKAEDEIPQNKPVISAGMQWNFQLPVYGAKNYFKGSSTRSQPYTILLPGATTSGLMRLSKCLTPSVPVQKPRVGPRELNVAMPSSLRASVPNELVAPTVITDGSLPGLWIAP